MYGEEMNTFLAEPFLLHPPSPSITQGFLMHWKEVTEEWEVDGSHMMFLF